MTTDALARPTREAKGKKLYQVWLSSSGAFPPGNYTPWEKLDQAQQGRWIWLAKVVGEPKHEHYMPIPADVQKYPAATQVTSPVNFEDWDQMTHGDPVGRGKQAAYDLFYQLWVDSRNATLRKHWWQFRRPIWVDTSRSTFEHELTEIRQRAGDTL